MTVSVMEKARPALRLSNTEPNQYDRLKVGIVGCGQVAKHHLRFIKQATDATVVGLADFNFQTAASLGRLYGVENVYCSVEELLHSTEVDVLHIVTPPESHYTDAVKAIDRGVHVLVEKPLTLDPLETEQLYQRASQKGVLICPDFIQLFNPLFQRAAAVIGSGELGRVVHVESYWSLHSTLAELSRAAKLHWSFSLPGGVMQNYITHPLYQVLFWSGAPNQLSVFAKSWGCLPQGITDHLHVSLEGDRCTADIVLSFALQQDAYYVQILCERGSVLVDFYNSTVLTLPISGLPKLVDRGTFNLRRGLQFSWAALKNAVDLGRGKLVPYQGLQRLIPAFYSSIQRSTPPPVEPGLATAVARAESEIFAKAGKLHLNLGNRPSRQTALQHSERILVTGASGYIGSEVVRKLVNEGFYVRAFVRPLSNTKVLERLGVELVYGDITDSMALARAMNSIDVVLHLAVPLRGEQNFMVYCAVEGTKNVAAAARINGVNRVIYMSSMAIYDYLEIRDGDTISEDTPLEDEPELRGAYSLAKREAEKIALSNLIDQRPYWTIVRPSMVVGRDNDIFSPAGIRVANVLLAFGSRAKHLRLIHIDDLAKAVVELVSHRQTSRGVYTISSAGNLKLAEYVDRLIRIRYPSIKVVYLPYWCCAVFVRLLAAIRKLTGKGPNISMHRLAYLYSDVHVDITAILRDSKWRPIGDPLAAIAQESVRSCSS